ncbi:DNA translocase FtsK 4TM domain-containing protein [Oribacterium sp. WCC10]|uniref:DNA translocase FtsK 4TM domain-containing protein n=1 Tax=Oribacterium sp. WCC10 TaxID=1855343 RepID=UPI0008ECBFF8|nr:DNA translocase FtsK 4TM domain-containing protein [Oribacterium sp. WCC10]SFG56479.1 4TM region of DNA translocase FtsK/SpoIIIE [Oribacterium sp. WCC10]
MARPKGSKNKTKKGQAARSRSKKSTYDAPMMGDEVAIIITFAISAFLFLSNLGLCGPIGMILKSIQLGLFGIVGFLFPIVLSFVVVFILSNLDNPYATFRMTTALFMLIFISAILQLTLGGGVNNMGLGDFYKEGAELGSGGGVIGGALAMVLYTITGKVGSMLILLAACFICLIYITGKPLARMLAESSSVAALRARDRAREDWNNVTTSARIHREERRLAREAAQREQAEKQVDFALKEPVVPEAITDTAADTAYLAAEGPFLPDPAPASEPKTDPGRILGPDEYAENTVELPLNVRHTPVTLVDPTTLPRPQVVATNSDSSAKTSANASYSVEETSTSSALPEVDTTSTDNGYDAVEAALNAAFDRMTVSTPSAQSENYSGISEDSYAEVDYDDSMIQAEEDTVAESSDSFDDYNSEDESNTSSYETPLTDGGSSSYEDMPGAEDYSENGFSDEDIIINELPPITPMEEESSDVSSYTEDSFAEDSEVTLRSNGTAVIGRGDMEQGTRRIVASNGQVIEADVEPVTKKIETQLDREKRENTPTEADNRKVEQEIKEKKPQKPYVIPPLSLLSSGGNQDVDFRDEIRQNAVILQETLKSFDIEVKITDISVGPSVTRYEIQPDIGVKVSKIVSLTDDIKMRLAATDIRIEAPIPGKSAVGIEVPNKHSSVVHLGDVLRSTEFGDAKSKIAFGVGKDISGKIIVTDIAKMPHLLIAGSTGSGKSVCINTLIMSMLFKYKPEELRMIMVDPKVVELSVYNGIPHLLIPVVVDPKKAAAALNWAVAEMTDRYKKFAETGSRDLKGYNEKIERIINDPEIPEDQKPEKLPQIVIIIDELADLMMVSSQEVEDAICRIAQLARAAGMHLVIATQRPTVNVITGLIKANVPSRIAFAVSSGTDSRTIIDMNGAEKLLGKGDMLFFPQGIPKPIRVQGAFVSDQEVSAVTDFIKKTMGDIQYSEDIQAQVQSGGGSSMPGAGQSDIDDLFRDAGQLIIETDKASIGMLQRKFRIGFNRAARIMDQLADANVVGPEEGTKPRKILMSLDEFNSLFS